MRCQPPSCFLFVAQRTTSPVVVVTLSCRDDHSRMSPRRWSDGQDYVLSGKSNNDAGQTANRVLHLLQRALMLGLSTLELGRFVLSSVEASQARACNVFLGHSLRLSGTGWTGCPWEDLTV